MPRLFLSLLGPIQATLDGEPVVGFESDRVRALLAYLAVESDLLHRRETLTGLLWPDRTERSARQNLSQALFNLRRVIGDRAEPPFLLVTPQTLQFNRASDHWLDVTAFTTLLSDCETHRHRRVEACGPCAERLRQATVLYRGLFLEGFSLGDSAAFEEWTLLEQERLHRLATNVLCRLADRHERRGEHERTLEYARRQLEVELWQEQARRQAMRSLALSGRRGEALTQYETCRRVLEKELGVEPEAETTALYERIREGERLQTLSVAPPHNLPASLTSFVGRAGELAEIEDRLQDRDCRLLTLVGPGGIGKTRLALEAARAQRGDFDHGVFFVSLAALQSVEAIAPRWPRLRALLEEGTWSGNCSTICAGRSYCSSWTTWSTCFSPPQSPPRGGRVDGRHPQSGPWRHDPGDLASEVERAGRASLPRRRDGGSRVAARDGSRGDPVRRGRVVLELRAPVSARPRTDG